MSNTEPSKELDEPKNKLIGFMSEFNIWCLCDNDECVKSQNFDIAVSDIQALIDSQLLSLIKRIEDEVIGEDVKEPSNPRSDSGANWNRRIACNDLRQNQRTKLKQLFNIKDTEEKL